jgi:hypothetical protein
MVVDYLPMAKPEADSELGIHQDQCVQVFVQRWCLVVPSEGHDALLHYIAM